LTKKQLQNNLEQDLVGDQYEFANDQFPVGLTGECCTGITVPPQACILSDFLQVSIHIATRKTDFFFRKCPGYNGLLLYGNNVRR